jgi:hypothetical protein
MNPAQLHHFVEKEVQSNTKAELAPYKARGQEITGTENTVAKRYGAYGEATQSLLGGIQSGAEAGAKTADNAAAETAVKSQGEVNTAGQNATTLTGGQLEPSVKAGTEAGATNIAGLGAAAQANAVSQGQNETNLLASIRAAAAQRVTEGQKGIISDYSKERGKNQAEEGRLLAKQSGDISKLTEADSQKQFEDKTTEAKLRSEGVKTESKIQHETDENKKINVEIPQREADTRKVDVEIPQREADTRKVNSEVGKQAFDEWAKREEVAVKNLSAVDKNRYDEAEIKVKQENPSKADAIKYYDTLQNTLSIAKTELAEGKKRGFTGQQLYSIIRKQMAEGKHTGSGKAPGKPIGQNIIDAALNLAVYGRLSTVDQAEALANGMGPEIKPEWFKKG